MTSWAGDIRTTGGDVSYLHPFGVGHVAQDGEDGETRVETRQAVDDGDGDRIPDNTQIRGKL